MKRFFFLLAVTILLVACNASSTDIQNSQQEKTLKEAVSAVGLPNIINWTEMRLVKHIYELRDDSKLKTWVYSRDMQGKRHCEGIALGYGLPYGVQFSNPAKSNGSYALPNAEPNGLYPQPAEGTWWQMVDPKSGNIVVVYSEERWNAYPYQFAGIPCPGEEGWLTYESK